MEVLLLIVLNFISTGNFIQREYELLLSNPTVFDITYLAALWICIWGVTGGSGWSRFWEGRWGTNHDNEVTYRVFGGNRQA